MKDNKYEHTLTKAKSYCAYQERCKSDIAKKLAEWKAGEKNTKRIIDHLTTEGFLDEDRFARIFTGGKFRVNKWGRIKIISALRAKAIPDQIIESSMKEINEKDYQETLESLLEKKRSEIKETKPQTIRNKLINYARSRGFEMHLILKCI